MGMITPLRIALFEENPRLHALLSAILLSAGHSVSTCSKDGYSLATFLQELIEELRPPYIPYYDLYIIDVSDTPPCDEILTPLEHLMRELSVPMILLAAVDNPTFELIRENVAIVPVHLRTILQTQDVFAAIETTMGMSRPLSVSELREVQQQQREHVLATMQTEQPGLGLAAHCSINARNGSPFGNDGYRKA